MSNKKSNEKFLSKFPLNINYENIKERKILEFDPRKIKAGEATIVKVDKWAGLSNTCFAVLNVDGKNLIIKPLKEEKDKIS